MGTGGAKRWALLCSGHRLSCQFPSEEKELPFCQALDLWEVLPKVGSMCPVV